LEVDDEFILGRRLYWQVARLLTLEDTVDVTGGAAEGIDRVGAIGDQPAVHDEVAVSINRGQPMPGRERNYQLAMHRPCRGTRHNQAAIRLAREYRDGALDLAGIADIDGFHLNPERRRHALDGAELTNSNGQSGIPKDSHPLCYWRSVAKGIRNPNWSQAVVHDSRPVRRRRPDGPGAP